jgi:hypothetical protein
MQYIRSLVLIATLAASSGSQAQEFTFEQSEGMCQFLPEGAEDAWFEASQLGQDKIAFTLQRQLMADGGWSLAYNLGWSYEEGIGVEPSEINAYMWYQIGALHPCLNYDVNISATMIERRRDELGKTMRSRDISEATRAAVICLVSNLKTCEELSRPWRSPPPWWQFWH